VSRAGKPVLDLVFSSAQIVAAKGGSPGAGGYVSPAFGMKVPAVRLAWRGPVGDDGVTVKLLMPA
jgi:hypothetical protein